MNFLSDFLSQFGLSENVNLILQNVSSILIVCVGAYIINYISKSILIKALRVLIRKTKSTWDDAFLENHVLEKITHFAPLMFFNVMIPIVLKDQADLIDLLYSFVLILLIVLSMKLFNAIINSGYAIYLQHDVSKEVPIKGFIQILKIINFFITGIFIVSILIDKSPFYLLSGLGALTAVLLFVFKDVLLGLIAGIQLTANKMIRHGDWIDMPKYGADGEVLDITLATVKVNNWDKTITTIPTYALISESFKNWRGMSEAGGRRIKRSVLIDLNSVSFCSDELLEKLSKVDCLKSYLNDKTAEINEHNQSNKIDLNDVVNGRKLTNIGIFRIYLKEYLKRNKSIRNDMTFIVRQCAAVGDGLPLEIYIFTNETAWALYEDIQSDIFDHIYAVISQFDLKLYQKPSGKDFQNFTKVK